MKTFSIIETFRTAINLYFKNIRILLPIGVLVGLCFSLLSGVSNVLTYHTTNPTSSFNFDLYATNPGIMLLFALYRAFMINFCLKLSRPEVNPHIPFSKFFDVDFDVFHYFVARLRYVLTVAFGMVLFIIPGLAWFYRYYFAHYLIIDKQLTIRESFAASASLTYGVKLKLMLFTIIMGFFLSIVTAGFIKIMIFLYALLYMPISILAQIAVYKQLSTSRLTRESLSNNN